jgi:hypothetical protein
MTENPQTPQSNFSARWSKSIVTLWVFILTVAYLIFIKRQYVDIIFESQFLHIDFLRDISLNQLTPKGFFTVFGEHLFPGYNTIFAANYYLFGLWGGFDSIVYAVSLLITAVFVVGAICRSSVHNISIKTLIALTAAFLLLSPTNNPQWGMALAASIGVTLFVLSAFLFGAALDNNSRKINPFTYIALAFAILFFLGGYGIGAVAAIFLLLIVWVAHNRVIDFKVVAISVVVFTCLIIYVVLVSRYGSLLVNKPTGATINFQLIGQFVLLMTGSSLLGKAFFELTQKFWPYYLCGAILLFWSACLFKEFIQRPAKGRMFVLAIATYSIVNILVVSIFRFKNGLEGAMGQWYNVHTHFITVAVCFYLFSSLGKRKFSIGSIAKILSIGVIFVAAAAGYYSDWKKSEHIPGWKNQFVAQAPVLLAFPELIPNLKNPMNTMLWNYPQAKAGVEFLYSNNLWIFKNNSPLVNGLSDDGWFQSETPLMIVCPSGSKKLNLQAWRPEGWKKSTVAIKQAGGAQSLATISNSDITVEFTGRKSAVLLDGSNLEMSQPTTSENDPRHLVAIVKNISCEGRAGQTSSMESKALPQSIELNVYNWGPQAAEVGTIPNKQPDGSMGIWFKVSDTQSLGDAQVIFDGKPAKETSVQDKLITALISSEQLKVPGDRKIYIRLSKTGKLLPLGVFNVKNK